jgi:hypothetical protein
MTLTPASAAASAAAAAAVPSWGQMIRTWTPWVSSASTFSFSFAEELWLKRISAS